MIWQVGKGFFKVIWQLIRMSIIIANALLNGMPQPSRKYKPYTEHEAYELLLEDKITIDDFVDSTEN